MIKKAMMQTTKQCSKHNHQMMSSSSGKGKEMLTKQCKIITSTLFSLQDNKLKVDEVSELNKVRSAIEGLELDDNMKLDLIQSMSIVSSSSNKIKM